MELTKKQFKRVAEIIATGARLSEVKRFEGLVPSSLVSTRKRTLKNQLTELLEKEDTDVETVNIHIEVPGSSEKVDVKDKKSFTVKLKDLFSGNLKKEEEDDDDNIGVVLRNLIPDGVYGKIVREL